MFCCGLAILLSSLVLSASAGSSLSRPIRSDFQGPSWHFVSAYTNDAKPERKITTEVYRKLFENQGTRSQVFEIQRVTASRATAVGRWSCLACKPQILKPRYPALAKILDRSGSEYTAEQRAKQDKEIQGLAAVGQLLDHGADQNGVKWIIVLDMRVTGKRPRRQRDLIRNIISATGGMTFRACMAAYQQAYDTALKRMELYVTEKEMLHQDVNPANVLFSRDLLDAEFIDWGCWEAKRGWDPTEANTQQSIAYMRAEFIDDSPRRCKKYP